MINEERIIISNDINVYFLDIGQGDSTLITQKNKITIHYILEKI